MANDTGSNYFIIPGGETPAPVTPTVPTEPVSPFEKYLIALENLQPPVSLLTSNDPSTPTFTPMAPPTAVRVSPPITPTEPVSPFEKFLVDLENLQPPVDLNYKEPAPTPVYSTPLINRPTGPPSFQVTQNPSLGPIPNVVYGYDIPKAVSAYEPDLSNPSTIDQPSFVTPTQPPTQGVETGGGGEPTESVEVGDGLITDENKNKYLTEYKMDLQGPNIRPTVTSPPEVVAPPEVEAPPSIFTPTPVVPTPVTPTPTVTVPEVNIPDIVEPPKTTFPIATVPENPIATVPENPIVPKPVVPTTPAIVPVTPINRQPIVRPLVEPTTIPIATRKMIESLSPGYFKDINYDPDEILAAAMRSMGGRQARRSILNELR